MPSIPKSVRRVPRSVAWGVPAVAAVTVAAGLAIVPVVAGASPALPPRTAAQLLSSIGTAGDVPFSGRILQTSRLGLPDVPGLSNLLGSATSTETTATAGPLTSGADLLTLLTGSHTGQIWYAGKDQVRVAATLGDTDSDLVRNGRDLWVWDSASRLARHATLPADADASAATALPSTLTPQQLADQALAAVTPSTEVTVDGTAKVAGRDAYELVLRPKAAGSLIREIRLALDSATSVPLRAQVYATTGDTPALEAAFSSISFTAPDPAVFSFALPSGATRQELGSADAEPSDGAFQGSTTTTESRGHDGVTTTGTDWTTVVELPAGTAGDLGGTTLGTPVSGSWGSGTLIRTSLVDVLLLEDGRVLAGAVTPEVLEAAAS